MISKFEYKIIDLPFEIETYQFDRSVEVQIFDENNKLTGTKILGYVSQEDWFNSIKLKNELVYKNCFIDNFNLDLFRDTNNIADKTPIFLTKIELSDCIIYSQNYVSFRYLGCPDNSVIFNACFFIANETNFSNSIFACSQVVFDQCNFYNDIFKFEQIQFNDCDFILKNSSFSHGNKSFQNLNFLGEKFLWANIDFNTGNLDFSESRIKGKSISFEVLHFSEGIKDFNNLTVDCENFSFDKSDFGLGDFLCRNFHQLSGSFSMARADFKNGNIDFSGSNFSSENKIFTGTNFGSGKASFKNCNFNSGIIDFHYSTFGVCDIIFDRSVFGKGSVDFRAIEVTGGKISFNRTTFGSGDKIFEASKFGECEIIFKNTDFGNGKINFNNLDASLCSIHLLNVDFGKGAISFNQAKIKSLKIFDTEFNSFTDLRLIYCDNLDLSNIIIKDIVDMKPTCHKIEINSINLSGIRLLGKIYIDWDQLNLKELIQKQPVSETIKAEQFRMLKENFNTIGSYDEEDLAYIEFKRNFAKAKLQKRLSKCRKILKPFHFLNYYSEKLIFDKIGHYGTNPIRVIQSMLIIYLIFSLLYYFIDIYTIHHIYSSLFPTDDLRVLSPLSRAFYHSIITFFTIGYGDYYPDGILRVLSGIEGFIGMFLMSYFTVAFARKALR